MEFKPKNSAIFVVDDASTIDLIGGYSYRFETQQGIAKAKNKCLELAQDFDHIFLVDDDVYPKVAEWEKPYIESGINHLCLTFEKNKLSIYPSRSVRKIRDEGNFSYYTAPNGCMLYLRKKCLELAGFMRPEFGLWGYEHVEYSHRIHALGLTPEPFIDVKNSLDYFEVLDWSNSVESSLSHNDRMGNAKKNFNLYQEFIKNPKYVKL